MILLQAIGERVDTAGAAESGVMAGITRWGKEALVLQPAGYWAGEVHITRNPKLLYRMPASNSPRTDERIYLGS